MKILSRALHISLGGNPTEFAFHDQKDARTNEANTKGVIRTQDETS